MGKKSRRAKRDRQPAAAITAAVTTPLQRSEERGLFFVSEAALDNPYVVRRNDFRRVVRWPNDGIEQEREKNLNGGQDGFGRIETDDPDTIAMTELLGGYPSKKPLCEIEPTNGNGPDCFIRSLPFMMQHAAAKRQSNLTMAKAHLIEAYKQKDMDVRRILKEINCEKAVYKGSCDKSRFPDFQAIIVPLFQQNLATDENVELLFGKVSYVRHLLLEMGAQLAEPPPKNSPAGQILSQFIYVPEVKAAPAPKTCAECGLVNEAFSKCTACKTVAYCGADCQKKHWPIHRPDCLRSQGKDVPEKIAAKARKKIKKKEELKQTRDDQDREDGAKQFMEDFATYANEQPCDDWAHDCNGKRLPIHVPTVNADQMIGVISKFYLQLRQVQILSLCMFPDGIDPDTYGFRGIELVDQRSDAHIIVLFERLFADGGEGGGVGLHIDGVFVVEKVVNGRAWWKLVPEPKASYTSNDNRIHKLVKYLESAKGKAKSVPDNIDLGIHNPGDPMLSLIPTEFGNYVNIS